MKNAESRTHRCSNTDGRRAANDHIANGVSDFAVIGIGVADFLAGKKTLVEYYHALVGPFDGLSYIHSRVVSRTIHCSERERRKRIGQ